MSKKIQTCKSKTKGGKHCRAAALPGSDFCFFHDPEQKDQRREAQSAGGSHGRIRTLPEDTLDVTVKSCSDVVSLIGMTINQVRRGEIDPRVANAVGYLANIAVRALEQSDIEMRLAELESAVKGQRSSSDLAREEAT